MTASSSDDGVSSNLSRRAFVSVGLACALAAVTGATPSAAQASPASRTPSAPHPFELEEATIAQLQQLMVSGRYTSRALCEMYLKRNSEIDRSGPAIRSVLQLNPVALAHSIAPRDSYVAARLRAAGAVILGETNLSEWANYRSTHASSGWSGMGGQTHNPYALDRTPSGSSSGSGAATAASLCAVAVGTETDGSSTSPSAAQSLVGINPTVGLVSRSGIIPISHSQDTAGPMARTVTDAAILLGALTGVDPRDAATSASARHAHSDYTTFLYANGLKGARIGIPRKNYFGYSAVTDAIINQAIVIMRSAGATIIDPIELGAEGSGEGDVLAYEFMVNVNAYLASLGAASPIKTLADLIAFNAAHRSEEMPYFGQKIFERSQARGPLADKKYRDALAAGHRPSRARGIDAAVAGYPHITVPAGYSFGLPVRLSFFGPAWSEPVLIKLAYAFEQKTNVRQAPRFLSTADLSARA